MNELDQKTDGSVEMADPWKLMEAQPGFAEEMPKAMAEANNIRQEIERKSRLEQIRDRLEELIHPAANKRSLGSFDSADALGRNLPHQSGSPQDYAGSYSGPSSDVR